MSNNQEIRLLTSDDLEDVIQVSKSVWEDDYVPSTFLSWISNPLWHLVGKFVDGKLVGFGGLEQIKNSNEAWVRALRVRADSQKQHHGTEIVQKIIDIAKDVGVKTLRYGTSSRNTASQKLALGLGFQQKNSVGYFRIEHPFPPRPKSSPNYVPLIIDAERLHSILQENPGLVDHETIPFMWAFFGKDLRSLERLSESARFRAIIDHDGSIAGIYIDGVLQRNDKKTMVFSVFADNQSLFVDIISRIFEEAENESAESLVFFLGNNAHTWIQMFIEIPEDYKDRRFLLFELNL